MKKVKNINNPPPKKKTRFNLLLKQKSKPLQTINIFLKNTMVTSKGRQNNIKTYFHVLSWHCFLNISTNSLEVEILSKIMTMENTKKAQVLCQI